MKIAHPHYGPLNSRSINDVYLDQRYLKSLLDQIQLYWDQLDFGNEIDIEELTPYIGVAYATRMIETPEVVKFLKKLLQ